MNRITQIPIGDALTLLVRPVEICPSCGKAHSDYTAFCYASQFPRVCRACRPPVTAVIDINALDPLDPVHARNDIQFDYDREREEQRITPLQQKWENG